MLKYTIKKFIRLVLLLIGVSVVVFSLVELSPIDPIDAYIGAADVVSESQRGEIENYFQLDKPPIQRFLAWFSNAIRLDLGISTIYREPVIDVIGERFISSLVLMLLSWIFAGILGIGLGVVMGGNQDRKIDRIIRTICLSLSSIPTFLLGLVFAFIFAVTLKWFPIGFSSPIGLLEEEVTLGDQLYHLVLPVITLSLASFSNIALHVREKLIQVLKSDYVLLAKTRGYKKRKIIWKHGLRNILIPAITIQFASLSEVFGGSILAETVFSYPGLGNTVVNAGLRGDVALLLGITLFSAVFVFVGNFIANILYGIIDPKIRAGGNQ